MSTEARWEKVSGSPYEDERAHLGEDPKKPVDARGNIGQIFGYVGKNGPQAPQGSMHWHLSTVFPEGVQQTPNATTAISGSMQGSPEEVRARVLKAYQEMIAN